MRRRVVITGLGAVTGLGVGMDRLWAGLREGRSCLKPITRFDPAGMAYPLAGEVENLSAKDYVPKNYRKAVKVMARDTELAVVAARAAVGDAGLATRGTLEEGGPGARATYTGPRMGCHIGAGLVAADDEEIAAAFATARRADDPGALDLGLWGRTGMESLTPLWLLKYLPNMLACHVTIIHGCEGPSNTITCGEASGLLSIGESCRVIERGAADLCFSGGAESKVNLMGLARLNFAKRMAHVGPGAVGAQVVRPFDPRGAGGVIGEAGGILMLEARDAAQARGARAYAEIVGFGSAHSPMRPVVPDERALGADVGFADAVQNALDDARVHASRVGALVLMGSGMPHIDLPEAAALDAVFGDHLPRVPVVTVGPNIGNCAAGIGGILAAVGARCMFAQELPARLNAGQPRAGVLAGAWGGGSADLDYALVATSSLGGQNAAILLGKVL